MSTLPVKHRRSFIWQLLLPSGKVVLEMVDTVNKMASYTLPYAMITLRHYPSWKNNNIFGQSKEKININSNNFCLKAVENCSSF
jgi:hypothetical protein